jgi:hypothetical protein
MVQKSTEDKEAVERNTTAENAAIQKHVLGHIIKKSLALYETGEVYCCGQTSPPLILRAY